MTTPPTEIAARRVADGAMPGHEFTYSVVEPAPGDKRGERRVATRLRDAQIGMRRGHVLVECRIRDRSRGGARLRLDAPHALPKMFLLTDAASRTRFHALLVWQSGRDAGVRLTPVPAEGR